MVTDRGQAIIQRQVRDISQVPIIRTRELEVQRRASTVAGQEQQKVQIDYNKQQKVIIQSRVDKLKAEWKNAQRDYEGAVHAMDKSGRRKAQATQNRINTEIGVLGKALGQIKTSGYYKDISAITSIAKRAGAAKEVEQYAKFSRAREAEKRRQKETETVFVDGLGYSVRPEDRAAFIKQIQKPTSDKFIKTISQPFSFKPIIDTPLIKKETGTVFVDGLGYSVRPELQSEFRMDILSRQQSTILKPLPTTKPETKNQRIIRELQTQETYSMGGKTYFKSEGVIKSVKGGEDKVARWIEKKILGTDPSLTPIKKFKYGEEFSVRYAHQYLGKKLGDWWIKQLKKEGREVDWMRKEAPMFLTEITAELPTFAAFAPFMEAGVVASAQRAESKYVYDVVKKKFVKKADVELYLTQEQTGSVVKIHGKGLGNYQDKAARVRALLKVAKTGKEKVEALKVVKDTYGTDFLKEFVAQGELGFIPIKGTSKVKVPDEIIDTWLSRYDIPVIPKMKGIEFIEAPTISFNRFSVYEKPTNLFEEGFKETPRVKDATNVLVSSLIGSIPKVDTRQRIREKQKQRIREKQKHKTAVDTMTSMLTDTTQIPKLKQRPKYKRYIPRARIPISRLKMEYPRLIPLFDWERPRPRRKPIKKKLTKAKPKKFKARPTAFGLLSGLTERAVPIKKAYIGFEVYRFMEPVKKKNKEKVARKKPVKKKRKPIKKRDELSSWLY